MYRSQVPIVDFFQHMLPASRAAGYKIVLTMLVREADAPRIYQDIGRYWTSLHDATGPDILFVFAGANAATRLDTGVLLDRRAPVMYEAEDLAVNWGRRVDPTISWRGRRHRPNTTREFGPNKQHHVLGRGLRRGDPYLYGQGFAEDHTSEIDSLRRYLGLSRSQVPCLVFTALGPSASPAQHVTVPLSVVRSTVYQYVKNLSDFLEDAFEDIDKARGAIKRIRLIRQARQAVREESDRLASEESRRATLRILQLTDDAQRSKATRSECYQRLRIVRNPSDGGDEFRWPPSELISRLQKVIDLSFQEGAMPFSCDDDKMNPEIRVWSRLATDMRQFHDSNPVDTKSDRWDFFIAYSSTDKNVATRIHSDLSKIGRAFLDTRCVKPGDQWGKVIHSAQGNSRSTVLLITANTPTSWYAESECIRAIQLARSEGHIVVPVLYGTNARLPYGLEQIQVATIEDWQDLSTLPELVKHIVEGP